MSNGQGILNLRVARNCGLGKQGGDCGQGGSLPGLMENNNSE